MSDVVSEPVVHAQPLAIASDARPRGKKMMPCAAPQQRGKQWWGGKQSVMPMSDFSDTDSEDEAPSLKTVLSVAAGPKPHLRRLRNTRPVKRARDADDTGPAAKRVRRNAASFSNDPARINDMKMLDTHPVIEYVRKHIPIEPCGRCRLCKKEPCGKCDRCKNNTCLSKRSPEHKRCLSLGCSKYTPEEMERYRRACNMTYTSADLRKELHEIGDRFQQLQKQPQTAAVSGSIKRLHAKQTALLHRLEALDDEDPVVTQQAPNGFKEHVKSLLTAETERYRLAAIVERNIGHGSPQVLNAYRKLRDTWGVYICTLARLFGVDMIASPYVETLLRIARDYERRINRNVDDDQSSTTTEDEEDQEESSTLVEANSQEL